MTRLAIDFDDYNLHHFNEVITHLCLRFGPDSVRYRKSSSGTGYHVDVDVDLDPAEELRLREELHDCIGRRMADSARVRCGLRSSRLFEYKTTVDTTDNKHTTRRARPWHYMRSKKDS